ncbi:MAG: lysophospholipid acyltransferase family protein [Cytophagales bacterium]|nr:1-acyl-sn-glycerol-3-phosphate acyltransferase [Bernardetiaceae bacterium]MDW8210579.1 lysophospholipid acyltransferase family protein [Cytophagales bacterium]
MLKKLLAWLIYPFFVIVFFGILVVFHLAQVVARQVGGYQAHKKTVDGLIYALLWQLRLMTGARITLKKDYSLPANRPLIVVSNHQSMYDIPLLGAMFAQHHPKYVSKMELAWGIPSVSYNLRHGGSVCIDRRNPSQAIPALERFGQYLEAKGYAGCIFPEGTRSPDGKMKPFKPQGLNVLLKAAPSAIVVPVAIEGSHELARYNFFPVPLGVHLRCTALPPISRTGKTNQEIIQATEQAIRKFLQQDV